MILILQKKGNINLTVADSGYMELTPDGMNLLFTLYSGYNYLDRIDQRQYRITRPYQRTKFREEIRKFNLLDFEMTRTNEDLFKNNYSMLNLSQLKKAEDSLLIERKRKIDRIPEYMLNTFYFYSRQIDSARQLEFDPEKPYTTDLLAGYNNYERTEYIDESLKKLRRARQNIQNYESEVESRNKLIFKHQAEWHRKFTLSFACFVLFFIGAPLGAIIRRGGLGLPVVVSILFFVLFHIISITSEKSVKSGVIDANIGMWIASVVLLPLGIFLTFKATTDSPILDADAWIKMFNKIFKRKMS